MVRETIVLEKFRTMPHDDGLPKYHVVRINAEGEIRLEDIYADDKVGRFHILMHTCINHCVEPSRIMSSLPIGVCFRKKTADRKLYEAAYKNGMDAQRSNWGLLDDRTDGGQR
jgi:hypothetical protein